jgi:hypothetical protein
MQSLNEEVPFEKPPLHPQHESGMSETTVTAEELGLIMTFLHIRKRISKF